MASADLIPREPDSPSVDISSVGSLTGDGFIDSRIGDRFEIALDARVFDALYHPESKYYDAYLPATGTLRIILLSVLGTVTIVTSKSIISASASAT
jgi:hypothetical protein